MSKVMHMQAGLAAQAIFLSEHAVLMNDTQHQAKPIQ